jgi:hypothetical protein
MGPTRTQAKSTHLTPFIHVGAGGMWKRFRVISQVRWTICRPVRGGDAVAEVTIQISMIEACGRKFAASVLRSALSALRASVKKGEAVDIYYSVEMFSRNLGDEAAA